MFLLIAAATFLLIMNGEDKKESAATEKAIALKKAESPINRIIGIITLIIYLIISFSSGAWFITWLIFPISACIDGVIKAILDLQEVHKP